MPNSYHELFRPYQKFRKKNNDEDVGMQKIIPRLISESIIILI